jgi:hypothetical protein
MRNISIQTQTEIIIDTKSIYSHLLRGAALLVFNTPPLGALPTGDVGEVAPYALI